MAGMELPSYLKGDTEEAKAEDVTNIKEEPSKPAEKVDDTDEGKANADKQE